MGRHAAMGAGRARAEDARPNATATSTQDSRPHPVYVTDELHQYIYIPRLHFLPLLQVHHTLIPAALLHNNTPLMYRTTPSAGEGTPPRRYSYHYLQSYAGTYKTISSAASVSN